MRTPPLVTRTLDRLDELARYSNVYRAARYWMDADRANCSTDWMGAMFMVNRLEKHGDLRFDDTRTAASRRGQLEAIGTSFAVDIGRTALLLENGYRRNLAILREVQRARAVLAGPRDAEASTRYFNRCRKNLDEESTRWLRGLSDPTTVYFYGPPAQPVSHALIASRGILLAHDILRRILSDDFLRRSLYDANVAKGATLTNWQIAADTAVAGGCGAMASMFFGVSIAPFAQGLFLAVACVIAAREMNRAIRRSRNRQPPRSFATPPTAGRILGEVS